MKNLISVILLSIIYLSLCWIVDFQIDTLILDSSGRYYNIENSIFYDKIIFYNDNKIDYTNHVIKYDRILVVLISLVVLVRVLKFKSKVK